nr:hypothetical protein [Treponemataceae bacterium]
TEEKILVENPFAKFFKLAKKTKTVKEEESSSGQDVLFGDNSQALKEGMDELETISDYVSSIPYENGLSDYVSAMTVIASNMNYDLKVMATDKIKEKDEQIADRENIINEKEIQIQGLNSALSALTEYFDAIYAAESSNKKGKNSQTNLFELKDGLIIAKKDGFFICYIPPEKRSRFDNSRGVIEVDEDNKKILNLAKTGDFVVAIPENPQDFDIIPINTYFNFE